MQAGRYDFASLRGRIGGLRDRRGCYHVVDGHHRMVAALEIWNETGDASAVLALIDYGRWDYGRWDEQTGAPRESRPLPARDWWGRLRNWLGY
jgi:filamentous hemagglutinin